MTMNFEEPLSKKALIEGVIFASTHPVSVRNLSELLQMEASEVEVLLQELEGEYQESRHGMALVRVAHGVQFRTKTELKELMAKFYEKKPPRLTQPTLEVLSIIAYKQPITRPEIDKIRGVDCTAVLKTLLERELIEMRGRSELPGHPVVYATTPKFMEWFQISSIADLPPLSEMELLNQVSAGAEGSGGGELLDLLARDDGFQGESLQEMDSTLRSVKLVEPINPAEEQQAKADEAAMILAAAVDQPPSGEISGDTTTAQ